jgi:hypothetical protein
MMGKSSNLYVPLILAIILAVNGCAALNRNKQAIIPGSSTENSGDYWRFEEGRPNEVAHGRASILNSMDSIRNGTSLGGPVYRAEVPSIILNAIPGANRTSLEFGSPSFGETQETYPADSFVSNDYSQKVSFNSPFPFNQLGDATMEFWFKSTGRGHMALLWGRSDSADTNRFHFYLNDDKTVGLDYRGLDGRLHVIFGSGGPEMGIPVANPFEWTYIAIVRSANTYTLYIDGKSVASHTDPNPELPTSNGWSISGRESCGYKGYIDELRVSKTALKPKQLLYIPTSKNCAR